MDIWVSQDLPFAVLSSQPAIPHHNRRHPKEVYVHRWINKVSSIRQFNWTAVVVPAYNHVKASRFIDPLLTPVWKVLTPSWLLASGCFPVDNRPINMPACAESGSLFCLPCCSGPATPVRFLFKRTRTCRPSWCAWRQRTTEAGRRAGMRLSGPVRKRAKTCAASCRVREAVIQTPSPPWVQSKYPPCDCSCLLERCVSSTNTFFSPSSQYVSEPSLWIAPVLPGEATIPIVLSIFSFNDDYVSFFSVDIQPHWYPPPLPASICREQSPALCAAVQLRPQQKKKKKKKNV